MQVAFYLAGGVTQVLDAIPWVRCASGNVLSGPWQRENAITIHNVVVSLSPGENGREHISVP